LFCFVFASETGSHYVSQAVLWLEVLLPSHFPKCWDYGCGPIVLVFLFVFSQKPFLLERNTGKPWLFRQAFDRHFSKIKFTCHFQRNKVQFLLPTIMFWDFKWELV
jgi:hypothetical protein